MKNPKFGEVRQVPTREFPTKFPGCLTLPNLGFLWVFFKYPKISKNGNPLFVPVVVAKITFRKDAMECTLRHRGCGNRDFTNQNAMQFENTETEKGPGRERGHERRKNKVMDANAMTEVELCKSFKLCKHIFVV